MVWLLLLAGGEAAAVGAVVRFFVRSERGQLLDTVALTGSAIGQSRVAGPVDAVLTTVSALSLLIVMVIIGFIALARRRVAVACGAMVLIVGANLTTQVLKFVVVRPEIGVDMERAASGNSLPSGHTTIAASVAVALVLVLPAGARGVAGILGALATATVGIATLSAGWHRPSDAVAALLIVGVWACIAGWFIVIAQRGHGHVDYGPPNRSAALALILVGLVLLAGAWLALELTDQVLATPAAQLGRRRLLAAYGGGAMQILGVAGLVMASVLVTAHRVVPQIVPPPEVTP